MHNREIATHSQNEACGGGKKRIKSGEWNGANTRRSRCKPCLNATPKCMRNAVLIAGGNLIAELPQVVDLGSTVRASAYVRLDHSACFWRYLAIYIRPQHFA